MPKSLLVLAVLAGLGAPASANESCGVSAPRFEPKLKKRPGPEEVKFFGGARMSRPVAEPCLRRAHETAA